MKKKSLFREYAEAIIIAIILALLIRSFVVQAFKIPSGSMIPSLLVGDHILVNKFIYRFKDPQRGDIMVFKFPLDEKRDFVKRVIGLGGDEIAIRGKQVYINNKLLNEQYAIFSDSKSGFFSTRYEFGPVRVPLDSYFVMGDNRDNSQDSRYWGFLKKDKVLGKAFLIYWSWDTEHGGVRWSRLGKIIP